MKPALPLLFLMLAALPVLGQEVGAIGEGTGIPSMSQDPMQSESRSKAPQPSAPSDDAAMFAVVDETAYIVGPGDVIYVAVGTKSFESTVGPDGTVLIESFPPIAVGNKSLAEARKILMEKISRYYKAGGIYVALAGAKKFQVSITGAVNNPGMYVAKAGSRVSNVIFSAGGSSRQSSHQVTIRRASGKVESINLGAYYRDGDLAQNPYLSQGDQVFVAGIDYSAPFVRVQTEKGVRMVQLTPGANLEGVVSQATDFENLREWDHVNVYNNGRFEEKVLRADARNYKPKAGATLEVRATQLLVFVGGTIVTPGAQSYNPTFTALDYIAKAGLTVNSAPTAKMLIIDAQGNKRRVYAAQETPKPGDHILVPRSAEAKMRDYIAITVSISSLAVAIATLVTVANQ